MMEPRSCQVYRRSRPLLSQVHDAGRAASSRCYDNWMGSIRRDIQWGASEVRRGVLLDRREVMEAANAERR